MKKTSLLSQNLFFSDETYNSSRRLDNKGIGDGTVLFLSLS